MAASHSAQDMVRPGECVDFYYYDGDTSIKQCFPTTQNTKYVQEFSNKSGGSSVFTIPPQNGIQDIVCSFQIPALVGTAPQLAALELPRGWGYALIRQVSFRYGGSSQYFLTGDQILQNALRKQPNQTAAEQLLQLGGNAQTGGQLAFSQNANIVLTLPHSSPSGVGKAHPLPTDLLTQQVQVTVELNPLASIFGIAAGTTGTPAAGAAGVIPSALTVAQFQVQQVMLNNQSDALARRVDMAENAYAFPAEFVQQVQRIPLAAGTASQSVVLTGFRSGECKAVHCWLTAGQDLSGASNNGVYNPYNWILPSAVVMSYAGDIYARYENLTSPLWNLVNGNKAPVFNNNYYVDSGAQSFNAQSILNAWVELPFAQTMVDEDGHYTLVHGKPITNGIVNLQVTPPASRNDWVLNVSYIYNTTLLFSQGTCDYVF